MSELTDKAIPGIPGQLIAAVGMTCEKLDDIELAVFINCGSGGWGRITMATRSPRCSRKRTGRFAMTFSNVPSSGLASEVLLGRSLMILEAIKVLCLFVLFLFGPTTLAQICMRKEEIPAANFIWVAVGATGFIYLQWLM